MEVLPTGAFRDPDFVVVFLFFSSPPPPTSNVPLSEFFISDSDQKKSSDFCDKVLDVWASLQLKILFGLSSVLYMLRCVCEPLVMIKHQKYGHRKQ